MTAAVIVLRDTMLIYQCVKIIIAYTLRIKYETLAQPKLLMMVFTAQPQKGANLQSIKCT